MKLKTMTKRTLNRKISEITKELMTVNYGYSSAVTGDRLAIKLKSSTGEGEFDLGGRSSESVKLVLERHLSFLVRKK